MRDVIDIDWILRDLEFQLKFSKNADSKIINAFGCDKMIKQALHIEFIQSIAPLLPTNIFNNFILQFEDFYYERFTLDDMNLRTISFESQDSKKIILTGDIHNYLSDDVENSLDKTNIFNESEIKFLDIDKLVITNGYNQAIFLTEPFPYPINIMYGSFTYIIPTKKHKYSIYLKSVGANVKENHDILSDLKNNTFKIDFEYRDVEFKLGNLITI